MTAKPTRARTLSRRSSAKPRRSDAPSRSDRFRHRTDVYAQQVLAGSVAAGPLVRLACERHLVMRELAAGPSGHPKGYVFDDLSADTAIGFFETVLRLPDTEDEEGQPLPFTLQPFQAFIIGSVFGWLNAEHVRVYREAYLEMGKGAGKTPLCAGIGLYGLVMDGEKAAEIYAAATTQDQAKILWRDAQRMVECSPELKEIIEVSVANLSYGQTFSLFRPVSAEHRGLDGKRPHMGLVDELHEHPNGLVVGKIKAGAKRRRQPLFVYPTNSGYDRTSVCWEYHEHSRRVLQGLVEDDRWFAYVCGLDEGDDPLADRACWLKANPNLGVTPTVEYLQSQVDRAKTVPADSNLILRLNFCVWTQSMQRFFDPAKWSACMLSVSEDDLVGRPCYAGFDSGQTDDFSAFARIWPLEDGRVAVRMRYWLPEAAIEKRRDRPYEVWRRAGLLVVTPGDVVYYDEIEADLAEGCRSSGVLELRYDKMFVGQLAQHLEQLHGIRAVDQPQGYSLNEALQRISADVASGRLCVGDDPILAWMADNAIVRTGRRKELRLDKDASRDKIDGIAALAMAYMGMLARSEVAPVQMFVGPRARQEPSPPQDATLPGRSKCPVCGLKVCVHQLREHPPEVP